MANVFTSAGAQMDVDMIDGTVAVPANWYIGWGTGAGTAAIGDTALFTESAEARVAATKTQPSANINKFLAQITASAPRTITNAGVLSASTVGTLYMHSDFTGIVLATGDKIEFDFQLTRA